MGCLGENIPELPVLYAKAQEVSNELEEEDIVNMITYVYLILVTVCIFMHSVSIFVFQLVWKARHVLK